MLQLIDPDIKPAPRPLFQLQNSSLYSKAKTKQANMDGCNKNANLLAKEEERMERVRSSCGNRL
jgi:hypothetical protein